MDAFDHHSAGFAASWRGQYRDIRATCPVMRVEAQGGFVLLTRYQDIRHVLLAPKDFASGRDLELDGLPSPVTGGVTVPANPFRMGMMEMDAPESGLASQDPAAVVLGPGCGAERGVPP